MVRSLLICSLLAGCGGDSTPPVDSMPNAACEEAKTFQNLANIENKIFKSCGTFSSACHNGGTTPSGMLDLHPGMSFADLVNVPSRANPGLTIVTPGDPTKSTLMLYLGAVAPSEFQPPSQIDTTIGTMPQSQPALCQEKLDSIKRWIMAGAPND